MVRCARGQAHRGRARQERAGCRGGRAPQRNQGAPDAGAVSGFIVDQLAHARVVVATQALDFKAASEQLRRQLNELQADSARVISEQLAQQTAQQRRAISAASASEMEIARSVRALRLPCSFQLTDSIGYAGKRPSCGRRRRAFASSRPLWSGLPS